MSNKSFKNGINFILSVMMFSGAGAQPQSEIINEHEVTRIESYLSSDAMKGRKPGSAEIENAAEFISKEFEKAGLKPFSGSSYLRRFSMSRFVLSGIKATVDGKQQDSNCVMAITSEADLRITPNSGYTVKHISKGEDIYQKVQTIMTQQDNQLVFIDSSFAPLFPQLSNFQELERQSKNSIVFVLGDWTGKEYDISIKHRTETIPLANVVGILAGKSKKNEYILISAHYDHLGTGTPVGKDSIYNGADDDASGTTAVIMLANYFAKTNINERTIIFAAFTAEELHFIGAESFSHQLNLNQVVGMVNIEMIGTTAKWGKGTAFITGFDSSGLGNELQENLKNSRFHFFPDPYKELDLFHRADNVPFTNHGVPAVTIATAQMDMDQHYHQVSDELQTLDLKNMTGIIKAIAKSSMNIISGRETPARFHSADMAAVRE